jgi:hypothetical protein
VQGHTSLNDANVLFLAQIKVKAFEGLTIFVSKKRGSSFLPQKAALENL